MAVHIEVSGCPVRKAYVEPVGRNNRNRKNTIDHMLKVAMSKPSSKGKQLFANVEFSRADMLKIGAKAIGCITDRVKLGRNVNDRQMKSLRKNYAKKKAAMGQPPIRNMMYSGSMLGSLVVVRADDKSVEIGFTRQSELAKAQTNQDRSDWFGASDNDEGKIGLFAEKLLKNKLGS